MDRLENNLYDLVELLKKVEKTKIGKSRYMIAENDYEDIFAIIDDMLENIPDEFKSAMDILKRKEEIIRNAKADASEIIAEAEATAKVLVSETEIYRTAQDVIANEEKEYVEKIEQYVADAYNFVDEKLAEVDENILEYALQMEQQIKQNSEVLEKMNEFSQMQLQSTKEKFEFISNEIFEARKTLR
ncbi:MAG: hypothetical protein ACK5LY_01370 [Lachnospirales bacterium]